METLDAEISNKIKEFLKTTKFGASSSDISKNIGHNRITITKYLEVMKAHGKVTYEGVAQAKLWRILDKKKPTILIVDDEAHVVDLISLSLTQDKYYVMKAYSGKEALEMIEKTRPDLIVLDIMMPDMSGYEVCKKLRENPVTQGIPIIILSAKGQIDDKLQGLRLGANDYITKPFDPMEIEARIDAILRRTKQDQDMHPLTKLLGKQSMRSYVQGKLFRGESFFVYCFRFDNLDGYRQQFGYRGWETVMTLFARMLGDIIKDIPNSFLAHTVNDRFIMITDKQNMDQQVKERFNNMLPLIYPENNTAERIDINVVVEDSNSLHSTEEINALYQDL